MSTDNNAVPGPGKSSSGPGSSASRPKPVASLVPTDHGSSNAGNWFGTLLYCVFSFWMFWFAITTWREVVPILITGFFAAWGVVYIVATIWKQSESTRFGHAGLQLDEHPAVGGRVRGVLTLPVATVLPRMVKVSLTCTQVTVTRGENGKNFETKEPVWSRQRQFRVQRRPRGFACAIDMRIGDVPEMRQVLGSNRPDPDVIIHKPVFKWELEVTTDMPGTDLHRTFQLDVAPPPAGWVPEPEPEPARTASPAQSFNVGNPLATLAAPARSAGLPAAAPVVPKVADPEPAPALAEGEPALPDEKRSQASGFVLIASNLVAIVGVVLWGWRVADIIMLYWLENLVIGAFNVARIMRAQPHTLPKLAERGVEVSEAQIFFGKLALAAFFCVHYGAFCFGHGEFLVHFFPQEQRMGLMATVFEVLREPGMLIAFIALIVSHAFSYFRNYIGTGEYLSQDLGKMMFRPYGRIFVVHIFVIFGGLLMTGFKLQLLPLLLFIALKIGIDFYMHKREREMFGAKD